MGQTANQTLDINVPKVRREKIPEAEASDLRAEIKDLLKRRKALLVAHYYTDEEIQILAENTGGVVSDSLEMARFGHRSEAKVLVVAGVRFMGETAKILNPEKTVLMPEIEANCSLDLGCPPDKFQALCNEHSDRTVVVYANTSVAVKAKADWMVTSGSAVDVVSYLRDKGEKILWAPDKYLGDYVQKKTGADMLMWNGSCVVHEEFKARELQNMRRLKPHAAVIAHPESPAGVLCQADYVGSTTGLIDFVKRTEAEEIIVATDKGIFRKMELVGAGKKIIAAPTAGESATCRSCAECPWMAMNSLIGLRNILRNLEPQITVSKDLAESALLPISRLLDFAESRRQVVFGNNDA